MHVTRTTKAEQRVTYRNLRQTGQQHTQDTNKEERLLKAALSANLGKNAACFLIIIAGEK